MALWSPRRWLACESRVARAAALRELVAAAPAFFALGAATTLLYTVDQLIAGAVLGATAFGLYSTAYLGNSFLVRIPGQHQRSAVSTAPDHVWCRRDPTLLARHAWRATMLSVVIVGPLVGAAIIGLPLILSLMLPAYAAAIPAMRLVLLAVMGLVVAGPASQLLVSLGRQWIVVTVTLFAAVIVIIGSGMAATAGMIDIGLIALIDCLAYLVFGLMLQEAAAFVVGTRASSPAIRAALIAYAPSTAAWR